MFKIAFESQEAGKLIESSEIRRGAFSFLFQSTSFYPDQELLVVGK